MTIIQGFNNDLLLTEQDRRLAFERFPHLQHILDFPELREKFQAFDVPSNKSKKRRRHAGLIAIFLGAISLLGLSTEPLYSAIAEATERGLLGLFAICGILSVLLGTIGVMSDRPKEQWLYGRLATESIRQFYFLVLVRRTASAVGSTVNSASREAFVRTRSQWWSAFLLDLVDHLPGQFRSILDGAIEWPLCEDPREGNLEGLSSHLLSEIFLAYRALRFSHQLQYANYKLRKAGWEASAAQASLLKYTTFSCIALVFIAHLLVGYSLLSDSLLVVRGATAHVFVMWACIVALTARALEEGLQPLKEIERYSRYKTEIEGLLARFDRHQAATEKLKVMEEMEIVVYNEMKGFLVVHDEARFLL